MNSDSLNENLENTELTVKAPKLNKGERKKARVIKKLVAGEINGPKAAKMLKLSTRQIRNLKRQYINEGVMGVVHKNHYHKPFNTFNEDLRKEIAHIYRVEFKGVCFTDFASEMQKRGYNLSRSTFYNILRQQRIRSPKRKHKKRKKVEKAVVTTKSTIKNSSKKDE